MRTPDETIDHFPNVCRCCGSPFDHEDVPIGAPIRHQVEELPVVRPIVIEHRLFRRKCRKCRKKTRAALPPGVPSGSFGSRLMAAVAMLSGKFRLTRRELPKILEDLFGVMLSVGTVQRICEDVSEGLAEPADKIAAIVAKAPIANADETSWRTRGGRSWMWVATSKTATSFRIHKKRGAEGLANLLPADFDGLLGVDRWKPYERFRRTLCHAHLLRNWREIRERMHPEAKRLGKWAESETERLLKFHAMYRAGEISRDGLKTRMRMLKARYWRLLGQALECGDKKTMSLANELDRQWHELWAYLGTEGAEPTNNVAERQLRPVVLWRKGSFGSWSDAGERFVERSMTIVATAKQIGADVFGYLHHACEAQAFGQRVLPLHEWADAHQVAPQTP